MDKTFLFPLNPYYYLNFRYPFYHPDKVTMLSVPSFCFFWPALSFVHSACHFYTMGTLSGIYLDRWKYKCDINSH